MTEDKSLTAVFKPEYTLTVEKVGGGEVSPAVTPPLHTYREDEVVTLGAADTDEWIFDHWSGHASGSTPSTSVTMTANRAVTAHFVEGVKITVETEGSGSVSPGTDVYSKGGTRTFTATPATPGWRWGHWEGDLAGEDPNDASLELPMDQARTITAVFIERVTLTVNKDLTGNLPAVGGTVSPAEGDYEHDVDTPVSLSAVAEPGWRFKEWTGAITGTNPNPPALVLDSDKTVTAHFVERHTVTWATIYDGDVTPNNNSTWDHGTTVSYEWDKHNRKEEDFSHWEGLPEDQFPSGPFGPGTASNERISLTINDAYHLEAYDESQLVTLTADVDAEGCAGCSVDPETEEYVKDDVATVTATAGAGWTFDHWEGDVPAGDEEDNPLNLTMDDDKDIEAVFKQLYELEISQDGLGSVDPALGTYIHVDGDTVSIEAVPAEGFVFDYYSITSWSPYGYESSESNPLSILMNAKKDVTAVFKEVFELNTAKSGQGIVEPEVGVPHIYLDGDYASLSASPAEDWSFSHWSGLSETDFPNGPEGPGTTSANPCTLSMNRDENVTANFVADCLLFEFPEPGISLELPQIVKEGANRLESLGNTAFGGFKFKLGGNYQERVTECQNIDGSRGTATKKTGEATLKFQKTDIPLYWGITKEVKSRMFGRNYKVKFTGGLRGDIGVDLIGQYEVLEYACPCLDEDECFSGRGTYNISGGVSGAVDFGTRLVAAWDTISGRAVEVEFCDINVANIAMTGRFGVENRWEGCDGQVCVSAYVDPIEFTFKVAIKGLVCKAISVRYPDDGSKLWEPLELCSEP